jgi:hypothetical protein
MLRGGTKIFLKDKNPFANAQKKNPRENPEGIRAAREIGWADLP